MFGIRSLSSNLMAAVCAAALIVALPGCSSVMKKPEIDVSEVRIADFTRETVQLTVILRVRNPNPVEIQLTDINAKLFLADEEVAKGETAQPKFTLQASGATMLPMRVNIQLKTLPAVLQKSALAIVSGGVPYKITGSVTTFNGLLTVPFEKNGELAARR